MAVTDDDAVIVVVDVFEPILLVILTLVDEVLEVVEL